MKVKYEMSILETELKFIAIDVNMKDNVARIVHVFFDDDFPTGMLSEATYLNFDGTIPVGESRAHMEIS